MVPRVGCETCKTRRIKCDGTKPVCQRCVKSRRHCIVLGAAKQDDFLIHNENCYASGQLKRPRGPRSSLTLLRPQFDLQTRALAYYSQYYLQTPKNVPKTCGGLSESISAWMLSGRVGSCPMVDLALSSMALAVFSRTQHHPPAGQEASSKYARLLRVVQTRIAKLTSSELDEKDIDSCLLAVSLMGRYENVKHVPDFQSLPSGPSWSHTDGSMAILKVWYGKLNHRNWTPIIKHTRRGLIRTCLLRNIPLPDWILDGTIFGELDDELFCDNLMVQLVEFHHATANLKSKSVLQITAAEALYLQIKALDTKLQDWEGRIPNTCIFQQHILEQPGPWPQKHFYSSEVYSYPQPHNAAAWSHYFALGMLFYITQLRVIEFLHLNQSTSLEFNYEEQRAECAANLKYMTNNLARSVPFGLERFKVNKASSPASQSSVVLNTNEEIKPYQAIMFAWPVSIASGLEGLDPNQQQWFRSELVRLGAITGDAVLECAATSRWAIL